MNEPESDIVPVPESIAFDSNQEADGDWLDYCDFRMTLPEFVAYQQKALAKFAKFWAQNSQAQIQEPEMWQNYLIEYCDHQSQYNVSSWPLEPKWPLNYRENE